MRKYIITFEQESDAVEPGQTTEDEVNALKNGDLSVDDLAVLAKEGYMTVHYSVIDV